MTIAIELSDCNRRAGVQTRSFAVCGLLSSLTW